MSVEIIEVKEEVGRGTAGGPYTYVVEGNQLVHISEYAINKRPGKWEDEVVYEIPKSRVIGKPLYVFSFSRSRRAFLAKCSIDDFEEGLPKKWEYFGLLEEHVDEIRHLTFKVKDRKLKSLLDQFNQVFIPMLDELKKYERALNFEINFMGHQERLKNAFESPDVYYFTFMSLPNDKSRMKSIKVTRRWIYQLWILKLLCEALQISKFKYHEYEGKTYWWVEQGSEFSTAIGESPIGDVTFWLEYQPSKYAHMAGILYNRRIPIRPDIVVAKGYFERTEEFVNSKKPIELIVECKEGQFEEWKNEIDSQIIPYKRIFNPRNFVVASLEPCLERERLETQGIKVVDNLKPNSESVNRFHNLIKRFLSP
ncbi:MAG: hypothetical protein QW102_00215 [Candidatus Nezhaarchaeales archaeon]